MSKFPFLTITTFLASTLICACGQTTNLPDLVIQNLKSDTDNPVEGHRISMTATIKNQGTAATPDNVKVSLVFYDISGLPPGQISPRKTLFWTHFGQSIAPGQTLEVKSGPVWSPDAGTHTILAQVNDIGIVKESDRTNNFLVTKVTVVPDPALAASMGPAEPSTYRPSPNEAIRNGNIPSPDLKPMCIPNEDAELGVSDGMNVIKTTHGFILADPAPDQIVTGADYVFSYRVKSLNVGPNDKKDGFFLWLQYPSLTEPPNNGGYVPGPSWNGTFNWKHMENRFRMPLGVSRYQIFFNAQSPEGIAYLTDLSLRPVDDVDMKMDPKISFLGAGDREQLVWIWDDPTFTWNGDNSKENQGGNMSADVIKGVPHKEVWFRRTLSVPPGITEAKAVFVGDDFGTLEVNNQAVGSNASVQDITQLSLDGILRPGDNEFVFKVVNNHGPGGLLGRIQWKAAQGQEAFFPTNDHWDCSNDKGVTWKPAAQVALPVPAPTQFNWCYAHLKKNSYDLSSNIPSGTQAIRVAVTSPGSFRILLDSQDRGTALCASRYRQMELRDIGNAQRVTVSLEDITQPALGNGTVAFKIGDSWKIVPLSSFTHNGYAPTETKAFASPKSWPINIGSFEAAADRPPRNLQMRLDPWAEKLLAGSSQIFELGKLGQTTSSAFAPLKDSNYKIDLATSAGSTVQTADLARIPKGLESTLRPDFTTNFHLDSVPQNGAAFVLGVEDTDVIVSSLGVFVNGVFSGMPQVLGYNRVPGGHWLTNRVYVITIPKERFHLGDNALTIRILPSFYPMGGEANQAEEYISMMGLGSNAGNPYKGEWMHWNTLSLYALGKPTEDPVNGHPTWIGVNNGVLTKADPSYRNFMLRDLSYLGLTGTGAPFRLGVWGEGDLKAWNTTDPTYPDNKTMADMQLSGICDMGMKPLVTCEPGRNVTDFDPSHLAEASEGKAVQRYGKYFDTLETGNEVEHPLFGWDALPMAYAFGRIQMSAAFGHLLEKLSPNPNMKIIGQGWYFAWDFSVIDAQARQEAPDDMSWTDGLCAHNYGKSYILEEVGYYLLYGVNLPKPLWVTECGAWSSDTNDANAFDADLRGDLAFATNLVMYVPHPYDEDSPHFSLFSAHSKDALIRERANSFRRLVHTFGLHGKPLAWSYTNDSAMKDKLVFVNPVDAGKWIKVSFVNYEHTPVPIDLNVVIPCVGSLNAIRYGTGRTVAEATHQVTLQSNPQVHFQETLGPGEAVEYLITKNPNQK